PESSAGRAAPGAEGGPAAAESVFAAARYPLYGAGHLASRPPARAPRGGVSHPGAAARLAGIRPDRYRTHGTAGPAGTRPPRAGQNLALSPSGQNLALSPSGRSPPGPARGPVHGGRDDRGGTGRSDTLREPPTAHA